MDMKHYMGIIIGDKMKRTPIFESDGSRTPIKSDIRKEIKELDKNITNVVSREDGSLEVHVKKRSETTKGKVMNFINQRNLNWSFTRIDFHEIGG